MHSLIVIAAFALAGVTPFMGPPPTGDPPELTDEGGPEEAAPESEPDAD